MSRALFVPVVAVFGVLAVGCTPPPPTGPSPELCQPGTFSPTGALPCTPAPVGSFVDMAGSTEPTPCPIGTYQGVTGQVSCNDAAPGTFVDVEGAESATLCPHGLFQDLTGQVSCNRAPRGTFVDVEGAVSATQCPVGTYQPFSASTDCRVAPVDTYVDGAGAYRATKCPVGTTTLNTTGATSVLDCHEPLAVAYSNVDGADGFDASGSDVLIARLLDANNDGLVSVGDEIQLDRYPLDFVASQFGRFAATSWTVAGVSSATSNHVLVSHDLGTFEFAVGSDFEQFQEHKGPDGDCSHDCALIIDKWTEWFESILVWPEANSRPNIETAIYQSFGNPLDAPFLDVDIFI